MARILCLGDNTIDTYVDVGVQYPGGNALNVAAMCARLGADTAYLGCVGDDDGGHLLLSSLTAEGVDISRTRIRQGANARAFIELVDGDRRFIKSTPGVRADYRWVEADFEYIGTFDHVHTSIYAELADALPLIAARAKSLSFDASNRWTDEYLEEVLPYIDTLFLSASDLSEEHCLDLAVKCQAERPRTVVATRGGEGAIAFHAGDTLRQPTLAASVVDTLGAGDGFISGFLTTRWSGGNLHQSMAAGAAFASRVCGWKGGFGHGAVWQAPEDWTR